MSCCGSDFWSMTLTGDPVIDGLIGIVTGVALVLAGCVVAFWWGSQR